MKIFVSCLFALILILSPGAHAQDQEPVFADYAEMRQTLDQMMMSRRIADVMIAFGGSDEMTKEELSSLEARVRAIYSMDFEHVDMLKSDDMGNGWMQELYAYWTGLSYIYVTVLYHDRGSELVAINFKFNTDFDALIVNF